MALSLTLETRKALREALLAAFPDRASLAIMVLDALGIDLDLVSTDPNLTYVAAKLIAQVEAQAQLEPLLKQALADNPGNQKLQQVATAIGYLQAGGPAPAAP